MDTFTTTPDIYGGLLLSSDRISWRKSEDVGKRLKESLKVWSSEGVRGVWMKIYLKDAALVDEAAKNGFQFHHAQGNYVMMTRWLPKKEPNMLPSFANHYIGVGGLVINSKNQILVVQELYTTSPKLWKIPGGAVDKGEFLSDAVVREVREETGIKTEFQSIFCFRRILDFRYEQSDIYFFCLLKPLTETIKYSPSEISACQWMDIDDFITANNVHSSYKKVLQLYREKTSSAIKVIRMDQTEFFSTEKAEIPTEEPDNKPNS